MARIKLTQRIVDKLHAPDPSGKQVLYWDTELKGFGVLCSGVTNNRTFVVQRDLSGGKTRRVTIAPVNVLTVDKARLQAEGVLADFYKGIDPKGGNRSNDTLREVLTAYQAARKTLADKSRSDYKSGIERHLSSWLDRPLRTITREMVESQHTKIASEVEGRHRKAVAESVAFHRKKEAQAKRAGDLQGALLNAERAEETGSRKIVSGHATSNSVMRALRALWNFAADRSPDMPPNPVRLGKQWYAVPRRERVVRTEELRPFYSAALSLPNTIARDYILLMLFTGLRRAEAARLQWHDVDLAAGVLRIPAENTKAKRKLDIPLTDFVRDMLVARRGVGASQFVFPANSGQGHISEPKFPLGLIFQSCGVRVSAHDLRRTYITVAESADISMLALKALVNHSLGNDVTSGYVQMNVERLRQPAQSVCDKLKILCGVAEPVANNLRKLGKGTR